MMANPLIALMPKASFARMFPMLSPAGPGVQNFISADGITPAMGASFRFIHCADLHLGSGFYGLSSADPEVGNRLREAVFGALDAIVEKAKTEKVDFVLFSGDIFDSSNETPLTRSRFAEALKKIRVPCFIAYGNHDHKRRWESSIPLPKNAFVFPSQVTAVRFKKGGQPAALIEGASFSELHTNFDLTKGAKGSPDLFSIGVFHCDLDSEEGGQYAPCELSSLLSKNVDYWALGHIHKRAVVHERPYVVYPGNTQGRNPRESGEKGAYIVTVSDGSVSDLTFFRTGDIIWNDLEADITGKNDISAVIDSMGIQEGSMVRIAFSGRGDLDRMLRLENSGLRELIEQRTGCIVTGIEVRSRPEVDLESCRDTGNFLSAVIDFGRSVEDLPKDQLVDIICSTKTATLQRARFEKLSEEQLRGIVKDAVYMIIERMSEAKE